MIRQISAILLLSLFVFNSIGLKLVVNSALAKADKAIEISLDNKTYHEADLFVVKVPINLPYQNNWTGFERVDGEITIAGESYRYVQRKVENDTMFLQCIRNVEKINILQKANDYFDKINDDAADNHLANKSSSNHSISLKYQLEDFVNDSCQWQVLCFTGSMHYSTQNINRKSYNYLQQLIRPPQA